MELFGECWGAGAEAEGEPTAREVVEGGGHHGDRGGAASPDRGDAGGDADARGGERDLGEDDTGVEPPTFGDEHGVIAEPVGEDGCLDDEVPALLHRREDEGPVGTAGRGGARSWCRIPIDHRRGGLSLGERRRRSGVGGAGDVGVERDEGGVEPVGLDVDAGEPGGADEALEVSFARAAFEGPGPRTTERPLQGAGGRCRSGRRRVRRSGRCRRGAGCGGSRRGRRRGRSPSRARARRSRCRRSGRAGRCARRHGRGGRGARPLRSAAARSRRCMWGLGSMATSVAPGAGSGGWHPLRSRARRPARGSSPKTRRLCVRRFHSRYGPIRLKNAALKRPRAPCTSKPVAGDMAMAESITEGPDVAGGSVTALCADPARRVRRGTTPTSKTVQGRSRLGDVPGGDLGARPEPQAQADPFDVTLGGTLVDAQARRDLAVGAPLAHQARHLALASRQRVGATPWCGQAEEPADHAHQLVAVTRVREVRSARQHHELGAADAGGERFGLGDGCGAIVGAVHHQRRGPHLGEQVADVELVAQRQQRPGGGRARARPLVASELGTRRAVGVGGEDVGQHVRAQSPVRLDQPQDVVPHGRRGQVAPRAHPP